MGLRPEVESTAQVKSAKYGNDSAAQRSVPTTTRCSVSAMGRGGMKKRKRGKRSGSGCRTYTKMTMKMATQNVNWNDNKRDGRHVECFGDIRIR